MLIKYKQCLLNIYHHNLKCFRGKIFSNILSKLWKIIPHINQNRFRGLSEIIFRKSPLGTVLTAPRNPLNEILWKICVCKKTCISTYCLIKDSLRLVRRKKRKTHPIVIYSYHTTLTISLNYKNIHSLYFNVISFLCKITKIFFLSLFHKTRLWTKIHKFQLQMNFFLPVLFRRNSLKLICWF